jgi:hypothetical protein
VRVLVLGFPLPDPRIDNHNPFNAPSFFDYDAMVVDPATFTLSAAQLLSGEKTFDAHDGRPVVNGPTTASSVSAADQLRRRAEETQRLLGSGATIVVLARPNATQGGIIGFEGCDRYSWLPAPPGMNWGPPFLRAAEGKTVRIAAEDHLFAPILRDYRKNWVCRAFFDDQHPGLRDRGRVIARGGAGVPIAMEFEVLGGRLIFLPVFAEEGTPARGKLANRIVDTLTQLAGEGVAESEPAWERAIAVPGLEQLEAEVEEVSQAAAASASRLEAAEERSAALRSHRRLLTREGPEFTAAVSETLALFGFAMAATAARPALEVHDEGMTALVECEGSRDQVVEWPYIRLQRRLEERLLSKRETPRGIVVVNGFRGQAPDDRQQQLTDPLRIACENYRYCLVTGATLFAVVQRVLGGAGADFLAGVRRRLLSTTGLLTTEHALGEAEEQDAGPIF